MNRRNMLTTAAVALAATTTLGLGAGEASAASLVGLVDTSFILEAAQTLQLEIALGNVAKQKAQRPDVKAYAAQVVTDLTKQLKLLTSLAKSVGLTIPQPGPLQQDLVNAANALAAADFDFQYIFQQVNEFTAAVAFFQRGETKAQNKNVHSYFLHALPVVRKELKTSQNILKSMPGGAAALAA